MLGEAAAAAQEKAILENVRSERARREGHRWAAHQGAADAGFVYVTDVNATGDALKAMAAPLRRCEPARPTHAGVVTKAKEPELAPHFVDGLHGRDDCADALSEAGFGPAP